MERNIAVYNCDGELLQWIDQKRFLRLVDVWRVARVVKTRTGRVRPITLLRMPESSEEVADAAVALLQSQSDLRRTFSAITRERIRVRPMRPAPSR